MIKAIILDDGYLSKDAVVKFGKNYQVMSFHYFLSCLCKRHNDWAVRTAHREDFSEDYLTIPFDELKDNYLAGSYQSCEEFETLWESDELVDGIDLY